MASARCRKRRLSGAYTRSSSFWRTMSESLIYAADRIPEIAETIVEVEAFPEAPEGELSKRLADLVRLMQGHVGIELHVELDEGGDARRTGA